MIYQSILNQSAKMNLTSNCAELMLACTFNVSKKKIIIAEVLVSTPSKIMASTYGTSKPRSETHHLDFTTL